MIRDTLERVVMSFGVPRSKVVIELDGILGAVACLSTLVFVIVITVTNLPHYWAKTLISGGVVVVSILLCRQKLAISAACFVFIAVRFALALAITH